MISYHCFKGSTGPKKEEEKVKALQSGKIKAMDRQEPLKKATASK